MRITCMDTSIIITIDPFTNRVDVDLKGSEVELAAVMAIAIHKNECLRDIISNALKIECSL